MALAGQLESQREMNSISMTLTHHVSDVVSQQHLNIRQCEEEVFLEDCIGLRGCSAYSEGTKYQ